MDPRVWLALLQAAQQLGWRRGDLSATVGFPFSLWFRDGQMRVWTTKSGLEWGALAPDFVVTPGLDPKTCGERFPTEAEALAFAVGIPLDLLTPEALDAALAARRP